MTLLVYIAILVVLLIGRHAHWLEINKIPDPIGGLVPIAIPWFGALGAVTLCTPASAGRGRLRILSGSAFRGGPPVAAYAVLPADSGRAS
jgi:hypothetical protein